MKITLLSAIFALFFLFSCQGQKGELQFTDNTNLLKGSAVITGTASLGFESLQKHVLKPKCMACHSTKAGRVEPDLDPIDFDTYESTMSAKFIPLLIKGNPEHSRLYEEVRSGAMPIRGRLHDKEIEFIAKWIKACAPKDPVTELPAKCKTDGGDDDDDFDDDFEDEEDIEDDFDNDEF